MKKIWVLLLLSALLAVTLFSIPVALPQAADTTAVEREVPIAAGVWYPQMGAVPEKPMRYYRVRCWPGCHTGSSYGMHHGPLEGDAPIFPTSSLDLKSE
ncbi:MAG: hypothetical protein AB1896_20115 [Thermodesulfobacteriota bacterium]